MNSRIHRKHALFAMLCWLFVANAAWCAALMNSSAISSPSMPMTSSEVMADGMDHSHHAMMMKSSSQQGMNCEEENSLCCPEIDLTATSAFTADEPPVFIWLSWLTVLPEFSQSSANAGWCSTPPGSEYDPPIHLLNCSFLN